MPIYTPIDKSSCLAERNAAAEIVLYDVLRLWRHVDVDPVWMTPTAAVKIKLSFIVAPDN